MYEWFKKSTQMPCGICKQKGHNSRTCKSELALPDLFDDETIQRFRLPEGDDAIIWDEVFVEQSAPECIICCDEIGDEIVKIKCGHTYCVSCFVKDMRQRGTCAMCRTDICEAPAKKSLDRNTRSDIIDQWLDNSQQIADTIRAEFIEQMRASIDRQRIIRTDRINDLERLFIGAAVGTNLTMSLWHAGIVASEYTSYWYESDL
jgi:hypothetical protein